MGWKETLLFYGGPGVLAGIMPGDWFTLLRDNRFAVEPRFLLRAASITLHSVRNAAFLAYENRRYRAQLRAVTVAPPLFILGHWRSGTTHLHNLITVDTRFAFPNLFQVTFPQTFLSTEATYGPLLARLVPRRRPVDNVSLHLGAASEDELAFCSCSRCSPLLGWVFPRRLKHYEAHLTLRRARDSDIGRWEEAFLLYLKKLTLKHSRPLVLKSPPYTCRIRRLLTMFPDARFVHIHREPYTVFQSTRKLVESGFRWYGLQRPSVGDVDEWILRQYREMYDGFFDERSSIPAGHLHDMSFEALERDPVGELRRLYEALALPDFGDVEPALRQYVEGLAGYRRNEFAVLPRSVRNRVAVEWQRCFDEWAYPL